MFLIIVLLIFFIIIFACYSKNKITKRKITHTKRNYTGMTDVEYIQTHINTTDIFEILNVAYCYDRLGAKYRKDSLLWFETFLKVYKQNKNNKSVLKQSFTTEEIWSIYSKMAMLYEREYRWDDAIYCLNKCTEIDKGNNAEDYTRVGDILVKKDLNLAIEYYDNLAKNKVVYSKHSKIIDKKRKDVQVKKINGYKYVPRPRK